MSFHPLVLDDLRNEEKGRIGKTPSEHQLDAFEAMKKCFDFDKDQGKGGLLVLPTGAGKTFTTEQIRPVRCLGRGPSRTGPWMQTLADRVGRGGTGHSQDCQEDEFARPDRYAHLRR